MASIRASMVSAALGFLPYAGEGENPTQEEIARQLKRSRRIIRLMTMPMPRGCRVIDAQIPGVRAEWHVGPYARPDVRIVYFHGGGYSTGSPRTHRHFTATLARETGIPVLSVDYRLAPENPFPAAQDDAVSAYYWAMENGPEGPGLARKIFIGGDSAGGGLTLSLAMRLRDEDTLIDGALFMLSPWLDLTLTADSIRRIGALDVMLNAEHARRWVRNYAADEEPTLPDISPIFGSFEGLPPMFFTVAGREIVLDDTLAAVEKARAAGIDVHLERQEEMFHIWPIFFHLVPEGRRSMAKIQRFLLERIGTSSHA